MHIVLDIAGREREVDLVVERGEACVADLLAAAGAAGTGVVVDGRFHPADARLDEVGLYEGALVAAAADAPRPPPERVGAVLAVVGGPAAGPTLALGGGIVTVGRDGAAGVALPDPSVSAYHARLRLLGDGRWEVEDLASLNGTWVDGVAVTGRRPLPFGALVRLGATHVRLLAGLPADRPQALDPAADARAGLLPFNRPPRPASPPPPDPVPAPEPPAATRAAQALNAIALIAPLVLGGVVVAVTGRWYFALFMLLSPVMVLGQWLTARRAAGKERRTTSRAFRAALDELDGRLAAARAGEVARREALLPDPAEVLRRAELPSTRLWERRPADPDHLRLRAGIADLDWAPPVRAAREGQDLPAEVAEVVAAHARLERAAVEVDLSGGGVVGVVGDRAAALALARSLVCQAAVHHGPADLALVVLAAGAHAADWDWAKWLPHARDADGGGRLVAGDAEAAAALLAELLDAPRAHDEVAGPRFRAVGSQEPTGPTRLVVVDDVALLEGRRAPARLVLQGRAGPVAGIVVAQTLDQLPAVVTTVVDLRSSLGDARLLRPQEGSAVDGVVVCGVTAAIARRCARLLARYEDPELELPGAGLPALVRLLPLLGLDDVDAGAIARRWAGVGALPALRTPIGLGEEGVVALDLVHDGPHALVGGTTGSGKSELLRSLVAGLAAAVPPEHLVFVLVDYKGGSAFDACARLPHTAGLVTDLDEHLGQRALRSLEAELAHRERRLRDAGAQDLPAYLRAGAPSGPLPRLAVVVDEFATLAAELPDFLGALVGVAQRGRSLGMHLLLATQRPSGAVNANIKANTNLRIALRVQDETDSVDIVGRRDAARIGRDQPGRASVRLGHGEVVLVQTALSTAVSEAGEAAVGVRLDPFPFGPGPVAGAGSVVGTAAGAPADGATDLSRLVAAIGAAAAAAGAPAPRRPWLPMLPDRLGPGDLGEAPAVPVPLALADDPDHQRQVPAGWDPVQGHLALFGMVGSGTTTALVATADALARRWGPDECHLYALDFGTRGLEPLAALPHCGAVVGATEVEARARLIRHLRAELDRRRSLAPDALAREPLVVTLVDGIESMLAELDHVEHLETGDAFRRVFADGPDARLLFAVAGNRPGALPLRLGALVGQRYLFRLADPADFSAVGLRPRQLPAFVPGRAVAADGRVVQFALPPPRGQPSRWPPPARPPASMRGLPGAVAAVDLPAGTDLRADPARLVVGLADDDLGPAVLALHDGEHVTVAGPPRSGKSSLLALLAALVKRGDPDALVVAVADERSPLRADPGVLDAAGAPAFLREVLAAAATDPRRWWVLVDDAPLAEDPHGLLAALARARRPGLHLVAAGRTDDLRSGYGHWTRQVRQSRTGVLLQPALPGDGDLLSVRLPRRVGAPLVPGRGFLVAAGEAALVQVALPPSHRAQS